MFELNHKRCNIIPAITGHAADVDTARWRAGALMVISPETLDRPPSARTCCRHTLV